MTMRTSSGLRAGTGLCLGLGMMALAVAPPAGAQATSPVGGSQLAQRGLVVPAGAPALPVTAAASWLVADLDTGAVLAAKDAHGRYAPASTLKALTAVTLIPKLNPDQAVVPTFSDVNVEGSKVGLVQTVRYPVRELLTAMLVVSGNDAANTLASANGGVAKTVADMNAEARRLKAFDTHAVNANGLDAPGQLTSAYDLALIGRAGLQLPDFRGYVATKRATIRGPRRTTIAISSHDKLLWNYDGAIGIKNGYTVKARATFVGAATRGGHTLLVSLLRTNPRYWPEAAALLDWGFAATKAGVTPVGDLVQPEKAEPSAAEGTVPVQPAAAKLSVPRSNGFPLLPAAIVGAGVVVLGSGVGRNRRRRRRNPLKLKLPL